MSQKEEILQFLADNPSLSSKEIYDTINTNIAYATVKRILTQLLDENLIVKEGQGKGTRYLISPSYQLLYPVNIDDYFKLEQDERSIKKDFNLSLINNILANAMLFTIGEQQQLKTLQEKFTQNVANLSPTEFDKEQERLAIDLSWKSSQIEGNTYSLLETERLLKEKETAEGKPKDDATMLLNHKEALNFIIEHPDYVVPLTTSRLEDIHSILTRDLGVNRNIRSGRVGITGTNYRPLDNEHQIREALDDMCKLINAKENVFEKALLALVLLSYIQAFADGNKRTARIISNAILIAHQYCPLSFRTVDSVDYKKAMLIFYEQNNISAFKKIFIEQFEFAVNTYF
ncbi:cell filamentation protein Fic [Chitinophaga polysaccharea]|uniref:Fic family protein n=1 Tax=Chitinophaga polysaccharea TaxID=1293035 RepID=UPI001454E45C|nr:Fic family protein [Chitinophaga polysaccharea]NLR62235.1 cell filamentation protein Fic [Chitinophaga polysaccharea]